MKKRASEVRKGLLALIAVCVAFAVTYGPAYASEDGLLNDYTDKTVILQSNDVHGTIDGYQYIAGLRDELESRGADVILVDCGDYCQGPEEISAAKGRNAIRMMNKTGYDLATIGNHEFDYTYTTLKDNLSAASFAVISDNIMNPDGTYAFDRTKVIEGDVNIGFVGVTTPETVAKASPARLEGLYFLNLKTKPTIFSQVSADIADLKKDGADIIFCLSHLGVDEESAPMRSSDLWKKVRDSGLSYILDAHSHTVMTSGKKGEPIISTGARFENIGVITIDEKTAKIDQNAKPMLYKITSDSYSNAGVKAEADLIFQEIGKTSATDKKIKAANTLKVKGKTVTIKFRNLKKSGLKVSKAISFKNRGQGKRTYRISSARKGKKSFTKYFKINGKSGKITVKKKLKRGTYKVTVKVRAAGNANYRASSWKAAMITIRVR